MHRYATFVIKSELATSTPAESSQYRVACDNRVFEIATRNFTEQLNVRLGDETLSSEVRARLQDVLTSHKWKLNKVMAKWGAKDGVGIEEGWSASELIGIPSTDGGLTPLQMSKILSCHLSEGDEIDVGTTLSFIELIGEIKKTFTSSTIVRIHPDGDVFKSVQLYCVSLYFSLLFCS